MKNIKKTLIITASLALAAVASITSTLAYLENTAQDVNTMSTGGVKINQHEYERKEKTGDTYELKEFTQDKPLYPAVVDNTTATSTSTHFNELGKEYTKTVEFVEDINNVQDKIVFVENTGESDAYVRTIIAYEMGSQSVDDFNTNIKRVVNGDESGQKPWTVRSVGETTIDNNKYYLVEHVYNKVLTPGEFTEYSLSQVYMNPEATNEDCEALDGNKNGKYDILVFSQASQTAGLNDGAAAALNKAFYPITTSVHPWTEDNGANVPKWISSPSALNSALYDLNKNYVILKEDIVVPAEYGLSIRGSKTLNLNGHSITIEKEGGSGIYVNDANAELTITGHGEINTKTPITLTNVKTFNIEGVTINAKGYAISVETSGTVNINNAIINSGSSFAIGISGQGKANIYDGIYSAKQYPNNALNGKEDAITVYGGKFISFSPTKYVAKGYQSKGFGNKDEYGRYDYYIVSKEDTAE